MFKKALRFAVLGILGVLFLSAHLVSADPDRIKQWIDQLRKSTSKAKIQAAAILGEAGNLGGLANDALGPLANCLLDPDNEVRVYGAYALGRVGADLERTVSILCPLLEDSDEHVRYSAEWSLAEIARAIASQEISDEKARKLLNLFQSVERQMARGTVQERHVMAVKLARIRLESYVSKSEAANKAEVQRLQALQSAQLRAVVPKNLTKRDDLEASIQVSIALYEANDTAGRLVLVDRMANEEVFPENLRIAVLKHELARLDSRVADFALVRWQASGQRLRARLFDELQGDELNSTYGENVIRSFVPNGLQQWEQLCNIAESRSNSQSLRVAALNAVESVAIKQTLDLASLSKVQKALKTLACEPSEYELVRIASITATSELGKSAESCVPYLLNLVTQEQLAPEIRNACAIAIAKLVPGSGGAANSIADCLKEMEVDDSMFDSFVQAIGGFGSHGVAGLNRLLDGLSSESVVTRLACISSLEKIGIKAADAAPSLVALIANSDESVEVKSQAATALKQLGRTAIDLLVGELEHNDPTVREHILRALAIVADSRAEIIVRCLGKLSDQQEEIAVRSAAAMALGTMGVQAKVSMPALLDACEDSQPTELRSAAIIALARIDRERARIVIESNKVDSEWLVRASAAFGLHLIGSTTTSIERLLELLAESERDELVKVLIELGPNASPALLQIAEDKDRNVSERLGCIEAILARSPIPWPELTRLLADDDIGDQTAELIERGELYETDAAPLLIGWLRSGDLNTSTRNRIIKILEADGFGAAEAEELWADTFSLNQPGASRIARPQPKKKSSLSESRSTALPPPPMAAFVLPASETIPGFVADGSDERGFQPVLKKGDDQKVAVFYGTNRLPMATHSRNLPIKPLHVGLAFVALAAMLGCFFLFPRQSFVRYVIASLIGMGAFSTIALQAMLVMNWQGVASEQPRYTGLFSQEIQYGVCEVSIPKGHQPGELESPQLFKLEVNSDPEKHIVLTNVESMSIDSFRAALKTEMGRKGKNIFVFIHGYNVSFEDAARRTAQMAFDLKFEGAPIFYSWPSQAKWYSYVLDRENIQLSTDQIRAFLLDLATTSNADTINLIAHSMGNVGLTAALSEIEQGSQPYFNQVVLAAPDIDADVFKNEIASKIVSKSHRTTLYTSRTDLALISSRYFNQRNRAGDSGPEVIILDGIETIDATAVDSSLLGHSYYGSNVTVLDDLGMLLKNKPIETREYLKAIIRGKKPYWAFEPTRVSKATFDPSDITR